MPIAETDTNCIYSRLKSRVEENKNNFCTIKKNVLSVIIADDHPYLINSLEDNLNKNLNIKVIAKASSYFELIDKIEKSSPDILILDLNMPGYAGFDLKLYFNEIKKQSNRKIIVFSSISNWVTIHRCMELGADAYLEKSLSYGLLPELILRIYQGETIIYTLNELPKFKFSRRQTEILHLLADGNENDEIANYLGIESKTVQSYVLEIKDKFSEIFTISSIRPRMLMVFASQLGYGNRVIPFV